MSHEYSLIHTLCTLQSCVCFSIGLRWGFNCHRYKTIINDIRQLLRQGNTVAAPSWALTNKPELTLYFCSFFLFASLVQSVFLSSLQRNVCLYLHPVLNPPGQHHDDPAKPLQCLRLCHTVEMELLFSDVRSSASFCGISTGYSAPWQRLWFAQCHTALVMGGGPQWRYRLAMAPDK